MSCKLHNCTPENLCHWCKRRANKPEPPKKAKINTVSDKQIKRLKEYAKLRKEYLLHYSKCEANLDGCTIVATQIHHKAGKIGELLTDTDNFVAICTNCHRKVEDNPAMAKEKGLSINRVK